MITHKKKGDIMTKKREIYHCPICGNMVEMVIEGAGTLVCCGKPMNRLDGNTVDAAVEKHVPVIEKIAGGYRVSVGITPHPMEPEHFIQWIELHTAKTVMHRILHPGERPEAIFMTDEEATGAREYCNLHGLWKKD